MRGTVARLLRKLAKATYKDMPMTAYEFKDFKHGGYTRAGTTKTLTPDCQRYEYQTLKARW